VTEFFLTTDFTDGTDRYQDHGPTFARATAGRHIRLRRHIRAKTFYKRKQNRQRNMPFAYYTWTFR
jgi:hypothetical protein